jgi:anti-sigma factor RsiW
VSKLSVTEFDLHAYIDGMLPEVRRTAIEEYLAGHSEDAERLRAYRRQIEELHALFDPVLEEPVPGRLIEVRRSRWLRPSLRSALIAAWLGLGGVIGWHMQAYNSSRVAETTAWAHRAAVAHVIYSPEVRHPVEVGADQETHLVNWLSKRLGAQLKVPHLGGVGYTLVGGRLLPGDSGPVAQFMYQDGKGLRLTLYVRTNPDDTRETAFRFAQENKVGVFYWLDNKLGYALSGEIEKAELLRVATAVYRQLNP